MKKNIVFAVAVSLSGLAFAQDVAPLNPQQILQELEDIQTKQQATVSAIQKRNLDLIFKSAASKESAIALYEDAIMATQFQGANRENSQFRDWKKNHEDQLKNNDFRESARLHLFYMGLTLKKAADVKPEELVPQVADYLKILESADGALAVKDSLLKNPVSDGIFAKWLGLGPELGKAKDWEMNPGKADSIASKTVLPFWRKQKNPALIAYWDALIFRQGNAAGSGGLDFQEKNFATIRKPELLWQRAQEFAALDQPNRATQEMYGLIKSYPTHPKVGEWIDFLKKSLAGENK